MTNPIRTPRWLAVAAVAAMIGGAATPAVAQDAGGADPGLGAERAERRHQRHGRHRQMRKHRRAAGKSAASRLELLRGLGLSDAQLRTVLEKARAAQPIAADARRELARTLTDARGSVLGADTAASDDPRRTARRALRTKLKELKSRTGEKLAPLARDVLAAFTPEQRATITGFAAARGRRLDDATLVRAVGRRLARPMTVELLEAQLESR